ncbi:MAG: M24 family metallopeptidase [Sphingobacteriaceae bacterium]
MNTTKQHLIEAEKKALHLFKVMEERCLIVPGKTESELNEEVFQLAFDLYGIQKYWHKRIIRAGKNTLLPYNENPPNLTLRDDEILFLDFGPIFEDWEADFGRTYVIGSDPTKLKLKNDLEPIWQECKAYYDTKTSMTGAEYYHYVVSVANKYGWEFGGAMAGHIIGYFPHERLEKEIKDNYIHPQNHLDMFGPDQSGNPREWILEIHLVDREKEIGGFFEQLLSV